MYVCMYVCMYIYIHIYRALGGFEFRVSREYRIYFVGFYREYIP